MLPLLPILLLLAAGIVSGSQAPAHFYVAFQVRDKLLTDLATADLGALLVQQNDAYVCGACAPDIATASYLVLEAMDAYHPGSEAHHKRTGDIVLDLLARARGLKQQEWRDRLTAFALGWLTHCGTDWVIHPLVNEFGGYYGAPKEIRSACQRRHKHLELVECEHVYHHATSGEGTRLLGAIPHLQDLPVTSINATFFDLFDLFDCSPQSRQQRLREGKLGITDFEEGMCNSGVLMEKCCKWFLKTHNEQDPWGVPFKQVLKGFPPTPDQYRALMDPLSIDDVDIERRGANSKLTIHYTINDFHLFKLFCDKWSKSLPQATDSICAMMREFAANPETLRVPNRDLDTGGTEGQAFDVTKAYPGNPVLTHLLTFVSISNENGADLTPWPKEGKWVWIGSESQEEAHQASQQPRVPAPSPEQGHEWAETQGFNDYYSGTGKFEVPFDDQGSEGLHVGVRLAFAEQGGGNEKKVYGFAEDQLSVDSNFSWTGAPPTDVLVVIDRSGNMSMPLEELKKRSIDVTDVLRELSPQARMGLLTYSSLPDAGATGAGDSIQIEQDFTGDLDLVNQAFARLTPAGQRSVPPSSRALPGAAYAQPLTAALQPRPVLSAVAKALQQEWQGRFKIVLLLADAESRPDPRDRTSVQQTAWAALKLNAVDVHAVLAGRNADAKSPAAQPFTQLTTLCRGQTMVAKTPDQVVPALRQTLESAIHGCFRAPVDTSRLPALPQGTLVGTGGGGGGASLAPVATAPQPVRRRSHAVPAIIALVLCLGAGAALLTTLWRRQMAPPTAWLVPLRAEQPRVGLGRSAVTTIGRAQGVQVRLLDDQVSSGHAAVEWSDGGFTLRDLGSTNGTYVNGVRITVATRLRPGDLVRVGRTEFRFHAGETAGQ